MHRLDSTSEHADTAAPIGLFTSDGQMDPGSPLRCVRDDGERVVSWKVPFHEAPL